MSRNANREHPNPLSYNTLQPEASRFRSQSLKEESKHDQNHDHLSTAAEELHLRRLVGLILGCPESGFEV